MTRQPVSEIFQVPSDENSGFSSVAWNPDGNTLAIGLGEPGGLGVWNVSTRQSVWRMPTHAEGPRQVVWSDNGQLIASAGGDRVAQVWSADSGKLLQTLKGHQFPVSSVAFSPDGKRVASLSFNREVKVWEWETARKVFEFQRPGSLRIRWTALGELEPGRTTARSGMQHRRNSDFGTTRPAERFARCKGTRPMSAP